MTDYGGFKKYWHQWIPISLFIVIGLLLVDFLASKSFFMPLAINFVDKCLNFS